VIGGLQSVATYRIAPKEELQSDRAKPMRSRAEGARAAELRSALAERTRGDVEASAQDDAESAERRAKLRSLGYVSGSVAPTGEALDPKDGVKLLPDLDAARHAVQLGDPRDAVVPMRRLLARNPGNIPARLLLGEAQLASRRTDYAIATYRAVAGLAPNNALAWFDLGNAYAGKAATDDAAFAEAKPRTSTPSRSSRGTRHVSESGDALRPAARPERAKETARARAADVSDPAIETELGLLEDAKKDAGGRAPRRAGPRSQPTPARGPGGLGRSPTRRGRRQRGRTTSARSRPSAGGARKPSARSAFTS
jgi:predicted Zn-dependent protease